MLLIQENISLKPYNTFRIPVVARSFVEIRSEQELPELFSRLDPETEKILILGGGSNMLFTKDFEGTVIKMAIPGIRYEEQGNDILVTAGAGVVWNHLVRFCVERGFAGLENLTLIPGTVGAAPIQNIGAYGVEIKDVFETCRAYDLKTGLFTVFSREECQFAYRESIFKQALKGQYIITSVSFRLSKTSRLQTHYGAIQDELHKRRIDQPDIADISAVVADIRVSKLPDPSTIGNAGSFFKNPVISPEQFEALRARFPDVVHYPAPGGNVKLAAGWLIEQCGYKGKVSGQTGTWKNQALVLVNHGHASGQEVYDFSEEILNSVYTRFGVQLSREVNIL